MKSRSKRLCKILLTGALAASMAVGLAACGSGSSEASSDTDTEDTAAAEESSDTSTSSDASSSSEETDSSGDLTTIRLAIMTNNLDHYYAIIGTEAGIFEEYGLQAEITEFAAGVNTVDAIVTGQADIGCLADYALVNRIGNTAEDTDLNVIARYAYSAADGTMLYVNPDKVSSLEDLDGQAIITLPGTVWDYWTGLTIDAAGLTTDDVEVLEVDSAQSALAVMTSGEGVAFWAGGLNKAKLEDAGMEPLISLDDLGTSTDQYYIANDDFMENSADTAATFIEAVAAIEEYMTENPEETVSIIAEQLDVDEEDVEVTLEALTYTLDFTTGTLEHLDAIQEWAIENGSFENSYDMTEFLSLDVLKSLYPDGVEVE